MSPREPDPPPPDWTQYGRQPYQPPQPAPPPQPPHPPRSHPQRLYVSVRPRQPNFLLRVLYFFLIGWWAAALWAGVALACCATIIGLPVGLAMLNRLGFILTLHES